jgi:hypothetical protein
MEIVSPAGPMRGGSAGKAKEISDALTAVSLATMGGQEGRIQQLFAVYLCTLLLAFKMLSTIHKNIGITISVY